MESFVRHHIKGNCGILEFGNTSGNSLTSNMLKELSQNLTSLDSSKLVKVIILKSSGLKAFSGGASFNELKTLKSLDKAKDFFIGFANLLNVFRTLKKFVILQVQGRVVGGGIGIVAACDYTIAYEKAEIKLSELSIGLGPFVIEPAISRKIGSAAFAQLSSFISCIDSHTADSFSEAVLPMRRILKAASNIFNGAFTEFSISVNNFSPSFCDPSRLTISYSEIA